MEANSRLVTYKVVEGLQLKKEHNAVIEGLVLG